MWFKTAQIFSLTNEIPYKPEQLEEQLAPLAFTPCLPSLPSGHGWSAPIGHRDDAPLVHAANGFLLFCLRFEEKILPATVVRQSVEEKVKKIEANEDRKVYQKEKRSLRDEISQTLLTRAFSKYSNVLAYIDTQNQLLVIDTTVTAKCDLLLGMLKRAIPHFQYTKVTTKKMSPILSGWLIDSPLPGNFDLEEACVLRDPNNQNRTIRAKNQNLFANGIQSLVKDGCFVHEIRLRWQDHINFTLTDEFVIKSIQYEDQVLELSKEQYSETEEQRLDADFVIMTQTLTALIQDLLAVFAKASDIGKLENTTAEAETELA